MPKLVCKCGYIHNLSPIPDEGWVAVLDKDYEQLIEAESNPENDSFFVANVGVIYECPECERIMWEKPGKKVLVTYVPEQA